MGGATQLATEMRNAHKILIGKPEGKGPLERPKLIWEAIKMDVKGAVCKSVEISVQVLHFRPH
jgi:hypothetical protein